MKKPAALRAFLTAALPILAREPERLDVFVDAGRVVMRGTGTLSYEQPYTLNLVLLDYAGEPQDVLVPLLAWLSTHQRELFLNHDKSDAGISFEADILDEGKVDLSIKIEMSERVRVTPRDGGGYDVEYLDEPVFDEDFPAVSILHRIYGNEQLLARCAHPVDGDP